MITIRPAQQTAVDWLRTRRRGCVVSPAGSGKTIIAAGALAAVVASRRRDTFPRIGWIGNTNEQCDQARAALAGFFTLAEVASVKVNCAAAATDWSDRDVLIVDECHHLSAPGWLAQIQTCTGAIWGFTATPDTGDEERDAMFYGFWQGNIHTIDRAAVAHTLSSASVQILDATDPGLREIIDADITKTMAWRRHYWKGPEQQLWGQVAWLSVVNNGIVANQARNAAALAAARNHSAPTLVLVNQVEHALWFESQLASSVACYAAMGKKKRAKAIQDFKDGRIQRLIGTAIFDEGFDAPLASVLILVSAGKSEIKTIQRTGRVLRRCDGKIGALVVDFKDDFHPLARKHSMKREQIYRELNYKIIDNNRLL